MQNVMLQTVYKACCQTVLWVLVFAYLLFCYTQPLTQTLYLTEIASKNVKLPNNSKSLAHPVQYYLFLLAMVLKQRIYFKELEMPGVTLEPLSFPHIPERLDRIMEEASIHNCSGYERILFRSDPHWTFFLALLLTLPAATFVLPHNCICSCGFYLLPTLVLLSVRLWFMSQGNFYSNRPIIVWELGLGISITIVAMSFDI